MILSLDNSHNQRRRKSDPEADRIPRPRHPKKKRTPAGEVGQALRSAYDRVVEEDIPPEMLDLLGKLG